MMLTNCENVSSNIPSSTTDFQPKQFTTPETRSASDHKAVVVGLNGVPGSGPWGYDHLLKRRWLGKGCSGRDRYWATCNICVSANTACLNVGGPV